MNGVQKRVLAVGLIAGLAALLGGMPAASAAGEERILAYDSTYDIRPDGSVDVTEVIQYDFGNASRHGLTRDIPTREAVDEDRDRVYHIDDVEVSSPSGAPADLDEQSGADQTFLRIGHPDKTVTGRQTYEIRYHLRGAMNPFDDHDELYWDAIGTGWSVQIAKASVTVNAPGGINKVSCFSDKLGADTKCAGARIVNPKKARFDQFNLSYGQPLTFVVGIDNGVVDVAAPEISGRNNRLGGPVGEAAAAPGPITYGIGGALLVGTIAFTGISYFRRGRDREYGGLTPGLVPLAGQPEVSRPARWFKPEVAPEFRPPDGVGPALAGTIMDERADALDVSAMIVDLAVRRYLHIEEIPPEHFWNSKDWRLTKLEGGQGQLSNAETKLLSSLFEIGPVVEMSRLKNRFASDLKQVQTLLYEDAVQRGWFHKSPEKVRSAWGGTGLLLAIAAGVGTGVAFTNQQFGLAVLGVALVIAGLVMRLAAHMMPARTATGTATLARVQGFRRYLTTAETDQLRFEEGEDIFSRYLPYAIVFGVTDRWAKVFAALAATSATAGGLYWYSNPNGFDHNHFGDSMTSFASTTSSTMSSTASSSSSGGSGFSGGFSGGGGGGGGGGSW
ncbi:DUF2207 domain-containing protein [Tenggerimyces flavus]|uniref:DUF2207 domain-containing protein n=1 Tax=Tenggerimyces flavus TaxID=1708749 RepID=A0ABV7YMT6_9ACTN|nr:DUF2207 domain-containing protein [Tenggerimyces flavus]MBM7786269.1 hypothetical protein [Tenggerimyces flavus]